MEPKKKRNLIPWLFIGSWFLVLALVVGTVYVGKSDTNKWEELENKKKERQQNADKTSQEVVGSVQEDIGLTGMIIDQIGVISPHQKEALREKSKDIYQKTGVQIGVLIVQQTTSTNGEDISMKEYISLVYPKWRTENKLQNKKDVLFV